MKIFKFKTVFILLSIVFSLSSCSDDDDSSSSSGDEYLTAKINGTDFKSSTNPATIIGATITGDLLVVQGGDNSGNTISFQIFGYTGIGTYATGDSLTSTNQIMYITISPVATWGSSGVTSVTGISPGTIEVTSDDGVSVEGTFSFEGYNASDKTTKNITAGKFKAELQ